MAGGDDMTGAAFQNCVRSLANLSWSDLIDVNVAHGTGKYTDFILFSNEPLTWLIRLDDDRAEKVWQLIQARQPKQDIVGR